MGKPSTNRSAEVREVFAHFRSYHPRAYPKPTPTQTEWHKIRARLAEGYSLQDLKDAIDGCHRSAFHCGENDQGKTYQNLELIVRDGSKVQQFLEVPKRDTVLSEKERRTLRAGKQWLERMEDKGCDQQTDQPLSK